MKPFVYILLLGALALAACTKDNGYTENTTSDGITMQVDYHTSSNFFGVQTREADVSVLAPTSTPVGQTAIYIDGNHIQDIETLPWQQTFRFDMLNEGDHEFWLVHTGASGITETLVSRFFVHEGSLLIPYFLK